MKIIIDGIPLDCHKGYTKATPRELEHITNGCGTSGWKGKLVPSSMYGLDIRIACLIHDYDYWIYKSKKGKIIADNRFLDNLYSIIDTKTKWSWVKWLRRRRAYKYYLAVAHFGDSAFYA